MTTQPTQPTLTHDSAGVDRNEDDMVDFFDVLRDLELFCAGCP